MSAIQRANFDDLHERYFRASPAHQAVAVLLPAIEQKKHLYLANLLRDYRARAVRAPEEIELRAAVDALLIGHSVMEMAVLTRFILPPDRSLFWQQAATLLANRQVQDYYVSFYPMKLPQLFRLRLEGAYRRIEEPPQAAGSFLRFLELDDRFMRTLNNSELMRMLDSFKVEGYWFSDVVAIIRQPENFIQRMLLPPEDRGVCDKVLHQFGLFMQFCFDLHALLEELHQRRLLQSAIWHHYGYWFDIIGAKIRSALGDALARFSEWKPVNGSDQNVPEVQAYVAQATTVIKDLTSPKYAEALASELNSALPPGRTDRDQSPPAGQSTAMD